MKRKLHIVIPPLIRNETDRQRYDVQNPELKAIECTYLHFFVIRGRLNVLGVEGYLADA